jgi:hypothetical protein
MANNSWTYPVSGKVMKFPAQPDPSEHIVEVPTELHYFTKQGGTYTPSGVLRSMALFIDGLAEWDSVENITVFPELGGWAGMVAVYHDMPPEVSL